MGAPCAAPVQQLEALDAGRYAARRGAVFTGMAAFPYVLSPYLRPVLRDGVVLYDNGLTGALEMLSPTEDQVVRALWIASSAPLRFYELCAERGEETIRRAVAGLRRRLFVFRSREECDQIFDQLLDATLPETPFIDQIELTNRCPMRCGFCPRGVPGKLTRPTGTMSLELFERLLGQLHPEQRQYRAIELHHLGESLVLPQVDRYVSMATERRVPTELSVNPSLLTPDVASRLLDAGIRRLVLSLDGMDDETLTALRGPAAKYGLAERNIDALLELAAARDAPPEVVIQMLEFDRNREQRAAFRQRWGQLGLAFLQAYIKPLEGPDPDLGRVVSPQVSYLCSYPWRSVVVLWDGRVVPCCRDADAQLVLGDAAVQDLREIWHGTVAAALREALRRRTTTAGHLCFECRWSRRRFADSVAHRHPDHARENPLQW